MEDPIVFYFVVLHLLLTKVFAYIPARMHILYAASHGLYIHIKPLLIANYIFVQTCPNCNLHFGKAPPKNDGFFLGDLTKVMLRLIGSKS